MVIFQDPDGASCRSGRSSCVNSQAHTCVPHSHSRPESPPARGRSSLFILSPSSLTSSHPLPSLFFSKLPDLTQDAEVQVWVRKGGKRPHKPHLSNALHTVSHVPGLICRHFWDHRGRGDGGQGLHIGSILPDHLSVSMAGGWGPYQLRLQQCEH